MEANRGMRAQEGAKPYIDEMRASMFTDRVLNGPLPLQIKVKRLTPTAILPTKAYANDMGWDLYADANFYIHDGKRIPYDRPWIIDAGKTLVISTGIAIELPKGWGAYNRPRSSQGKNNIDIYGGVIDNGYRGEMHVSVHNSNEVPVSYHHGERIGQLVLTPSPESVIVEVDELSETERGDKRFGSSGR